jgi:hypothetical protein
MTMHLVTPPLQSSFAQPEYSPDLCANYGSSQGSGVVSRVSALHPKKKLSRTQLNVAAGITVTPKEGL